MIDFSPSVGRVTRVATAPSDARTTRFTQMQSVDSRLFGMSVFFLCEYGIVRRRERSEILAPSHIKWDTARTSARPEVSGPPGVLT